MTSPKRPRDPNQLAKFIVDAATGDEPLHDHQPNEFTEAQRLAQLGGLKGGKARAARLTADERTNIARNAANTRWKNETSK